jgi:glycine betaine/choline ABC-type transport system substrate-binding protein
VGEDGRESEEIVLISTQKKREGEVLSEMIVRLLNAEEERVFQQ